MHIILNLKRDGAQQVVRMLVGCLASENCTNVVCTFQDGPLRQEIEQLGVKVEVLPARRHSIFVFPLFLAEMIRIGRALTRLIQEYHVDVIQTHLLESLNFLVLFLRYTTRLQVVLWTFHNANFGVTVDQLKHKWLLRPKRIAHNLLYRLTYRRVSGFIAVSDEVKAAMVKTIGPIQDQVTVICNGVDVARYSRPVDKTRIRRQLGLPDEASLLAVVGRLTEQKGHRYFLEAMSTIAPRHPDVHALFIGEGALRGELQAQIERLELGQQVHLLGNRNDVPDLLAASDVFVLPSLWEGLSIALLEAMAAGKPIVATAVSGTNQVMIPGKTGLVVPPGDSQALANAILSLLADPAQAKVMGQEAEQHVAMHFSAQRQASEHLALYHRLLAQQAKA